MRIIAGKFKGIQFAEFQTRDIRPTTDRAKEGLFTILEQENLINGKRCLDLFAGSGSVSLELLSRGASFVKSVDKGRESISYMLKNKKQAGLDEDWNIVSANVLKEINVDALRDIDLIFADPPYQMTSMHQLLNNVTKCMKAGATFVLEHHENLILPTKYLTDRREYGKSVFSFFVKTS
jgi:16S rRNA (guanine966-N2)-methyltransferase